MDSIKSKAQWPFEAILSVPLVTAIEDTQNQQPLQRLLNIPGLPQHNEQTRKLAYLEHVSVRVHLFSQATALPNRM